MKVFLGLLIATGIITLNVTFWAIPIYFTLMLIGVDLLFWQAMLLSLAIGFFAAPSYTRPQ